SSANAAGISRAIAAFVNGVFVEDGAVRVHRVPETGGGMIVFYEFPGVRVRPGEEITVELVYPTVVEAAYVERISSNAHTLPIASRLFDPRQPGLFRGAYPSLTQVWRSSYSSKMMVTTLP